MFLTLVHQLGEKQNHVRKECAKEGIDSRRAWQSLQNSLARGWMDVPSDHQWTAGGFPEVQHPQTLVSNWTFCTLPSSSWECQAGSWRLTTKSLFFCSDRLAHVKWPNNSILTGVPSISTEGFAMGTFWNWRKKKKQLDVSSSSTLLLLLCNPSFVFVRELACFWARLNK
jgi:hypothetical protein